MVCSSIADMSASRASTTCIVFSAISFILAVICLVNGSWLVGDDIHYTNLVNGTEVSASGSRTLGLFSVCGIMDGQTQFDNGIFSKMEPNPWSVLRSTECYSLDTNQVEDWKKCDGQCDHPSPQDIADYNMLHEFDPWNQIHNFAGACLNSSITPVGISATKRILEDKVIVPRALQYAAVVIAGLSVLVPVLLHTHKLSLGVLNVFLAMHGLQVVLSIVAVAYMGAFNSVDTHIDSSYARTVSSMSLPFTKGATTRMVSAPNCQMAGDGGPNGNDPTAWSYSCHATFSTCMNIPGIPDTPGCHPLCTGNATDTPDCLMMPFQTVPQVPNTGSCNCALSQLEHAPGVIDAFTADMGVGTAFYLCVASIVLALASSMVAILCRGALFTEAAGNTFWGNKWMTDHAEHTEPMMYENLSGGQEVDSAAQRRSWMWVMPSVAMQSIALNCAISFIVPVKLGFYIEYYGGQLQAIENYPDVQSNLDTSTAVLVFLFSGLIGQLSDSFGRKPFFVASNVMNTLPMLFLWMYSAGIVDTLWIYNYVNVASGVLGATYAGNGILSAIIADTTTPEERMKAYGYLFAAFSIGFCVSPIIGAYVASYLTNSTALFLALALCVVNCLYSIFVFPETLHQSNRTPFEGFSVQYFLDLIVRPVMFMRRNVLVACLATISFMGNFPENGVQENSLLFLQNQIGFMALDNAWVFFQTGFFCVVVQITLLLLIVDAAVPTSYPAPKPDVEDPTSPAAEAKGTSRKTGIILIGLFAQLLHLAGYIAGPWLEHKTWFFLIETLSALSFVMMPAVQDIVSERVKPSEQGLGLGALAAVNGLASGAGPLVFGKIYAHVMTPDPSTASMSDPCSFPRGLTSPLPNAVNAYIVGAVCVVVGILLTVLVLPYLIAREAAKLPEDDEPSTENGDTKPDGNYEVVS